MYVNPRPTFASLGAHYPDDYFCYVSADDSAPLLRPIIKSLARGFPPFVASSSSRRPSGASSRRWRILDVGCGLNELLLRDRSKERGAVGTGVDMKDTMVARSREKLGMPIVHGTLESAHFDTGKFDLVTMIEYLEHELNPSNVLAESRRVLKTGGHVAIEIPFPGGWPARKFKNRWANLDVPRHLVFFDKETLVRASLRRARFRARLVRDVRDPVLRRDERTLRARGAYLDEEHVPDAAPRRNARCRVPAGAPLDARIRLRGGARQMTFWLSATTRGDLGHLLGPAALPVLTHSSTYSEGSRSTHRV